MGRFARLCLWRRRRRWRDWLPWLLWRGRPINGIRVDKLPQIQLAGVVGDLVDPIKPFVRALKNHRGDGLGGHRGGRESKVTSMGEVGPDRGFLAVGRQKRLTRKASTGGDSFENEMANASSIIRRQRRQPGL